MNRLLIRAALAVLLSLVMSAPALAGGSAAGGIYTEGGNGQSATGAGVMLSTGNAVPVLPVALGLTGFLPLARGGGYALTAEGSFLLGKDAIGVGYGIGQFGGAHAGGTATVFFDHRIAPLTSLELRGYRTMGAQGATAGFVGLKFSL